MGEFSMWHWLVVLVVLPVVLLPMIFYCLTIQKALAAVDAGMRAQEPGLAWLLLIPLFNAIWIFVLVFALKTSYTRMTEAGRLAKRSDGAFGVGLAMAICWALGFIPGVNLVVLIPSIILLIVHWVKVADLKNLVLPISSAAAPGMAPAVPSAS